jgi:hypothetical protein
MNRIHICRAVAALFSKRARNVAALALSATLATLPQIANTQSAPANVTTIWWTPSESGWGLNLSEQGNTVFAAWYTYGDDGKALWLSGLFSKQATGSWTGPVYRSAGTAFDKISGPAASATNPIGNATLSPNADGTMQFAYTLGTTTQTKKLERFVFGSGAPICTSTTASRANATNYQDIWFNEPEPGWGMSITHQGNTIFAAWYTYRADGTPQWLSAAVTQSVASATTFTGALLRTQGTPLAQINGAPASIGAAANVGTIEFTFTDGQTATMKYTLDGVTQTKPIKRFVFATPQTVCATAPAPSAAVPTDATMLNMYLQAGSYKTWGAEAAIHPAGGPHPTNVRSFANPILEAAMRQGGVTKFPIGSATVKELYSGSNVLNGWAVSVKTANDGRASDWYWYEVLNVAPNAAPVANGNGISGCAGCHSAGTDYVRTRFPFQK